MFPTWITEDFHNCTHFQGWRDGSVERRAGCTRLTTRREYLVPTKSHVCDRLCLQSHIPIVTLEAETGEPQEAERPTSLQFSVRNTGFLPQYGGRRELTPKVVL